MMTKSTTLIHLAEVLIFTFHDIPLPADEEAIWNYFFWVLRKLLSILTAQSINQGDSRPFQALEFVATELGWSVVESSQIDPVVSCEKRIWARLFSYMTVHAKLRFTVNHINKTITIDDCIFEEPYEQELRQYL